MSFLNPLSALVAGAVVLPLLALLYILKLRRRRLTMASTLLWQRSFEDIQVNAPFQRLRLTPLFFLQALLLIALLLALAEPVIQAEGDAATRAILLIDRSASMSAADAAGEADARITRLEAAKSAARDVIMRLGRGRTGVPVMVIAFGRAPQVMCGFEARRDVLFDVIQSIEPSDEEANLDAALDLAGSFAAEGGEADEETTDVILVSDGGVAPAREPAGFALRAGTVRAVAIDPEGTDNIGFTALNARRDYDDPARVLVFARLLGTRPEPSDVLVTLLVDGEEGPLQRVQLGGVPPDATLGDEVELPPAAEATLTFDIDLPRGAVIGVRHAVRDALGADNAAAVVLPPPAEPRVAVVSPNGEVDPYLRDLLTELDLEAFQILTPVAYEADTATLRSRFELLIFDRVAVTTLVDVPSISFGATLPGLEQAAPRRAGGARLLSWSRQHPVMRHVSLDSLVYRNAGAYVVPPDGTTLAVGPDGPVIAMFARQHASHIAVAFALADSNWPAHVSVAVFFKNAVDRLTLGASGQMSLGVHPGESVVARAREDASIVTISGRGEQTVPARPGMPIVLPAQRYAGVYTVRGVEPPHEVLAVSVLSGVESDTRPRTRLRINAEAIAAGAASEAAARGIWPWFVALAFALLVLEWLVYCRRLSV